MGRCWSTVHGTPFIFAYTATATLCSTKLGFASLNVAANPLGYAAPDTPSRKERTKVSAVPWTVSGTTTRIRGDLVAKVSRLNGPYVASPRHAYTSCFVRAGS